MYPGIAHNIRRQRHHNIFVLFCVKRCTLYLFNPKLHVFLQFRPNSHEQVSVHLKSLSNKQYSNTATIICLYFTVNNIHSHTLLIQHMAHITKHYSSAVGIASRRASTAAIHNHAGLLFPCCPPPVGCMGHFGGYFGHSGPF